MRTDEQKHRWLSVQVLHDAWAVIDSADRLRSLVRASEIFDEEGRTGFADCMKGVRDLRNIVQHLDGVIGGLARRQWPVWGSLRWFEWIEPPHVGRVCLLMAGSRVTGRPEAVQEPRPGENSPGVSEVFLVSDGIEVSLRAVRENVALFAIALEQGASDEHASAQSAPFAADLFISANVDFRRKS